MGITKTVVFCLLVLVPLMGMALDPSKPLDQYAVNTQFLDAELPQSSVLSITQTSDGYLWFGTYEGLARFNGVSFRVFSKATSQAIKNNGIYALLEDKFKNLWMATPNGLVCYQAETGTFRHYSKKDGLSHVLVTSLAQDRAGNIWVGTTMGLNCLKNGKIRTYSRKDGLSHDYITALCQDANGWIWIGTYGGGLNVLTADGFRHYAMEHGLPEMHVQALSVDAEDSVWVGTRKGLAWFDKNEVNKHDGSKGRFRVYTQKDGLSGDNITVLYKDQFDLLWIGTYTGDLNRLKNGQFSYLNLSPEENNKVSAIYEDNEGSLWIGTYRSGMFQLSNRKFQRYNRTNGLPVNITRAIYQDPTGYIWIGTVGGGLVRFKDDKFTTFSEAEGLLDKGVWSITGEADGTIWFGTYGGGLHRLKNNVVKPYQSNRTDKRDIVRAVYVDDRGNIWAGTDGNGLDVYDNNGFLRNYNTKNGLSDNYIYAISEDNKGNIWVGTFNGGINLIRRDGRISLLGKEHNLPPNAVWVIYPERNGTVWVGTNDGGLCRYHEGTFFTFTTHHGLFSDTAFQILEADGFFWMNCNSGIYRVSKRELNQLAAGKVKKVDCRFLGRKEGYKHVEGTGPAQPAGFVDNKGKIWFPSLNGVIVITPGAKPVNHIPPPVVMEKATINGKDYQVDRMARVPPGKGDVELAYAGLSYLLPDKVHFRYKLEGYNNEWIAAAGRRKAFYTNLSPGRYRFMVTACNSDGVWNHDGTTFTFILEPHFYETTWFYLLSGLLVFFVGYVGVRFRERRHKIKARQLQQLVDEQTRELRDANNRLAELSTLDGLTEISNRRLFEEYLEKEWRRCQRNRLPISLLMVDVDFFKAYNDTYGHQRGDIALKSVAIILAHSVSRSGDMAARYGGEEFAVIMGETEFDGARVIAEKLRTRVASLDIPHVASKASKRLTISIGCATVIPQEHSKPSALVHAADKALYEAKHQGRNRVIAVQLTEPNPENETHNPEKQTNEE